MKKLLAAVFVSMLVTAPIHEAGAQSTREEAEEAIKEGAQAIMRALNSLIGSIPQYEAPEVLDNGDIIIRRKRSPPEDPKDPSDSETQT